MQQDDLPPIAEVKVRHRSKRGGRPFNTSTPLGKMIRRRNMRASEVAHLAGMSERKLSNLLAGRAKVTPTDAVYLARALACSVSDITGSTGPRSAP